MKSQLSQARNPLGLITLRSAIKRDRSEIAEALARGEYASARGARATVWGSRLISSGAKGGFVLVGSFAICYKRFNDRRA
jgi:hypothetical protein